MVFLNHPMCRNCPWKWGFDVPFDGIEIWNGPIKDADYDAIDWWHGELKAAARHIPAVGGSDSHRDEVLPHDRHAHHVCLQRLSRRERHHRGDPRRQRFHKLLAGRARDRAFCRRFHRSAQTAGAKDGPHECVPARFATSAAADVLKLIIRQRDRTKKDLPSRLPERRETQPQKRCAGRAFVRAEVWRTPLRRA
jgi:hypothetical protein